MDFIIFETIQAMSTNLFHIIIVNNTIFLVSGNPPVFPVTLNFYDFFESRRVCFLVTERWICSVRYVYRGNFMK